MIQTKILEQKYEVRNGFDDKQCITAIESQLSSKIFKELINGEKDSLTLKFEIYVNEETDEEKIAKDPEKAKMVKVIERIRKIPVEKMKELDLMMLYIEASGIDTRL